MSEAFVKVQNISLFYKVLVALRINIKQISCQDRLEMKCIIGSKSFSIIDKDTDICPGKLNHINLAYVFVQAEWENSTLSLLSFTSSLSIEVTMTGNTGFRSIE